MRWKPTLCSIQWCIFHITIQFSLWAFMFSKKEKWVAVGRASCRSWWRFFLKKRLERSDCAATEIGAKRVKINKLRTVFFIKNSINLRHRRLDAHFFRAFIKHKLLKTAGQSAVVERYFPARFEADMLHCIAVRGDDPGLPAGPMVLHTLADHFIKLADFLHF